MKQAALALLAPAAAILSAVLLQPLLIALFPTIQAHHVNMVSLDSYLEVIALLALSFFAAYLVKLNTAKRGLFAASLLFPTAFLALILTSQPLVLSLRVAPGMNGVRIVLLLSALAPLLGAVLAYVAPSRINQLRLTSTQPRVAQPHR
jgi:hypothetical protein